MAFGPFNFDLNDNQLIYPQLRDFRGDDQELQNCINETIDSLLTQQKANPTDLYKPVCLLGKIQSGKTRAFIGVIARALDEGINLIFVLTKNSTILGKQTTSRIASEFRNIEAGQNVDVSYIRDIDVSQTLGAAQLEQKRIIVGIKHNINIQSFINFIENNPAYRERKILIIDDEADISGVGYQVLVENIPVGINAGNGPEPETIRQENVGLLLVAEKINTLRNLTINHYFLQVTATPAALFLQPENLYLQDYDANYRIENILQAPVLPEKTILLPIHRHYVGGDKFFGEEVDDESSLFYHTYLQIDEEEIEKLHGRQDRRHINNIFRASTFPKLKEFVDNLLLGVAMNIACLVKSSAANEVSFNANPLQSLLTIKNYTKGFSGMVHTKTTIAVHNYQYQLIESYINSCKQALNVNVDGNRDFLKNRLRVIFNTTILPSLECYRDNYSGNDIENGFSNTYLRYFEEVNFDFLFKCYATLLNTDNVQIFNINTDTQMMDRIDEASGELKRDVLANIYIGGQSLDRGITMQRLIGFYYGRNPRSAQMDTTLQHARLYGARPLNDLVFTRIYCIDTVFDRLREITEIDQNLRNSIIQNEGNNQFAAIELGQNGTIKPTNPSRIMASNCINLKSYKRILPVGFNTRGGNACERHMQTIDEIITRCSVNTVQGAVNPETYFITWQNFEELFNAFMSGMINKEDWGIDPVDKHWDLRRLRSFYTVIKNSYFANDNRILLSIKRGRKMNRIKLDGKFEDAPNTSTTDSVEMRNLMEIHNVPAIYLFEQEGATKLNVAGDTNLGWNGTRFFWPMLMLPKMNRNIMVSLDSLGR